MRKIMYYVAVSLDGYISGPKEDISSFAQGGAGVEKYLQDLLEFDTVIMGRKTYEFGYKYGLKPGQPAYPHMDHYIFSNSLSFDEADEKVQVEKLDISTIKDLKNQEGSDIYLCGGGEFAGWLLEHGEIDVLKLKLNPILLGEGIRLFGNSTAKANMKLIETENYEGGLQIMSFTF